VSGGVLDWYFVCNFQK